MNKQEHIKRHKLLHAYLDELLADWIGETEGLPSKCTLMEFARWSHQQTIEPSDRHERYPDKANAKEMTPPLTGDAETGNKS